MIREGPRTHPNGTKVRRTKVGVARTLRINVVKNDTPIRTTTRGVIGIERMTTTKAGTPETNSGVPTRAGMPEMISGVTTPETKKTGMAIKARISTVKEEIVVTAEKDLKGSLRATKDAITRAIVGTAEEALGTAISSTGTREITSTETSGGTSAIKAGHHPDQGVNPLAAVRAISRAETTEITRTRTIVSGIKTEIGTDSQTVIPRTKGETEATEGLRDLTIIRGIDLAETTTARETHEIFKILIKPRVTTTEIRVSTIAKTQGIGIPEGAVEIQTTTILGETHREILKVRLEEADHLRDHQETVTRREDHPEEDHREGDHQEARLGDHQVAEIQGIPTSPLTTKKAISGHEDLLRGVFLLLTRGTNLLSTLELGRSEELRKVEF